MSTLARTALPVALACSTPTPAPQAASSAEASAAGPSAAAPMPAPSAAGSLEPGLAPTVRVESGQVSGVAGQNPSVVVYKGIPFAAPPIGERRWRPPEPPVPWTGVRSGAAFGKSCVQAIRRSLLPWTEEYMFGNDVDEDCLSLNVWAPAQAVGTAGSAGSAGAPRPVLVYIHGGAFDSGSGEVLVYDGEGLAKKGVIVVTINYRLGVFGFFCHAGLTQESPRGACGNYGLLDQIAALQWVQRNIAAFGGDPGRVTIAGQSAGAASVHYLTFSPLAKGLFQRAIAQSGPWDIHSKTTDRTQAEARGAELVAKSGGGTLGEWRALPAQALFENARASGLQFRPIIDGWVLPEPVAARLERGEQSDVPLLTGWTADERSFQKDYGHVSLADWRKAIRDEYGSAADAVLAAYPAASDDEASQQRHQLWRDSTLLTLLEWRRARRAHGTARDFGYLFERAIPWPEHPEYQAFHSGELPYVFDNLDKLNRPWDASDRRLADVVSSYWVNFITSGDPNGAGLPEWPSSSEQVMRLGPEPHASTLSAEKERLLSRHAARAR